MNTGDRSLRQAMLHVVEGRLAEGGRGVEMANAAAYSRFHFQRVFRKAVGEAPGTVRRRLVLERASWELRTGDKPVTQIALEAEYRSLEGFSRAFKRAFNLAPQAYRTAARRISLLPGASGVHYDPAARSWRGNWPEGKPNMDLTERLLASDYGAKQKLFACARLLSDAQLDAPLAFRTNIMPWVEPARTLRESLAFFAGVGNSGWVDQMMDAVGKTPPNTAYRHLLPLGTIADMSARFEGFYAAFRDFVTQVREENFWDQEWVDDTCDEPHTFTVGGVIEETLTYDIAFRCLLVRQFEQMGFRLNQVVPDGVK